MKKRYLTLVGIAISTFSFAQNNVGIGTTTPNASSALEVTSTTQGVLVPRLVLSATNVAAPVTTPAVSLLVYNTATAGGAPNDVSPGYYFWDGTQWVRLLSGAFPPAACTTLDESYDCTTPGGGRIIAVNDGSIEFNQTAGTNTEVLTVNTSQGTAATPNTGLWSDITGIGNAILGTTNNASADQVYAPVAGSVTGSTVGNTGVLGLYNGSNPFGSGMNAQVTTTDGGIGAMAINGSPSTGTTGNYGSFGWSIGAGAYNYGSLGVAGDGSGGISVWTTPNLTSAGVFGYNEKTTGGAGVLGQGVQGIVGLTDYQVGSGVFGINYGGTGTGNQVGVLGDGLNGVWGQTQADDGFGTYGLINGAVDLAVGAGVVGEGAGNDFGVFALGDYGGSGAKFFFIDHPQDPANKILRHYSIESNEPVLIYRGTVQLDANGNAQVTLPSYVDAINTDYSYTLTSIGAPAPNLYIGEELNNGTFAIAGGAPNKKASWVVYGKRSDAYFQANPDKYKVELDKQGIQRGKYVDPASHGKPRSESMFHNDGQIYKEAKSKGKATKKEIKDLPKVPTK